MYTGLVVAVLLVAAAVIGTVLSKKRTPVLSQTLKRWKEQGDYYQWRSHSVFFRDSAQDMEEGEEEPQAILLLLHGFPTSSFDWAGIWQSLANDAPVKWRILAPDFVGFGFSSKPCHRKLYENGLVLQADMIEDFLRNRSPKGCPVHILAHDYGLSVAQELIYRWQQPDNAKGSDPIELRSVAFLNGGLIPGSHRPLFIQTLLASRMGYWIGMFMTKGLFGKRFSDIWGRKPTNEELDDFWSLIQYNEGVFVQAYLLSYMAERKKNCFRWLRAIDLTFSPDVPMILIDGPADPVSGQHLAEAVARLWKVQVQEGPVEEAAASSRQVRLLPPQFGHYPQVECPSLVLESFFQFLRNSVCQRK